MSPKLKPLLLPQLVEERRKIDSQAPQPGPDAADLSSHVYCTTNSSSSDVASPVTPTFSPRALQRFSSSSSSLELPPPPLPPPPPPAPPQDGPTSPTAQYLSAKSEKRQLPDVQEDPMERWEEDACPSPEPFGLYSCLCDTPCQHRNSSEGLFPEDMTDFDIDYDMGFLSDGDFSADPRYPKKKREADGSPFAGLTSRLGSRLPTIKRWRSTRRANPVASPATDLSLENVLSRGPSSRSSSMSASNQQATPDRLPEMPPPASRMPSSSSI
ncbi:hypothetical protein CDD83_2306 [Cordyceps sp. RAO-2017]|nr:hypothetical protein CDD83_2306 [Cordyceps sp. RAO-2017]